MKFIHAADLHIDSPLCGLDRYEGAPVERLRSATRRAFEKLVELAIQEKIDFMLLAGDIYDGDWHDFHTGLYFREQMVQLGRAGIRVFIVQGNHDAQSVISKQLSLPEHVTVFSSRVAETVTLDDISVAIHGRSFPNRAVDEDLVPSYPEAVAAYFNIGLLHTSLTGHSGHDTYAPTDVATLSTKSYDYWALGHIHIREHVCTDPYIVFSGNLQGRHAKETGPKGCELVTVEGSEIKSEFVALDVVRWHQINICLDNVETLSQLAATFREVMGVCVSDALDCLHAVRVHLTGSTYLHGMEAKQPGTLDAEVRAAAQDMDSSEIWIEKVRLSLTTPKDRALLVKRVDAVGELVRMIDCIASDEAALHDMVEVELGGLLNVLPAEVISDDGLEKRHVSDLLSLLHDAEATVLARLPDRDSGL